MDDIGDIEELIYIFSYQHTYTGRAGDSADRVCRATVLRYLFPFQIFIKQLNSTTIRAYLLI